jgi:amino-acid N-acetyltransferase
MTDVSIRIVNDADYEAVAKLLADARLPTLGVKEHFQHYLVAENETGIVGSIGLEMYGETALLRSAVVHPSHRNGGIGSLFYHRLHALAKALGVSRLILLTNTAEKYFERKGFVKIDQESVSGPITSSVEFTGACPSHAACMELML